MFTDVILPVRLVPRQIKHRHDPHAVHARGAEGEEDEVHALLQVDDGARVVGVEGDVWFGDLLAKRLLSLWAL